MIIQEVIGKYYEIQTGKSVREISTREHIDLLNWVTMRVDYLTGYVGAKTNWSSKNVVNDVEELVKQYLER